MVENAVETVVVVILAGTGRTGRCGTTLGVVVAASTLPCPLSSRAAGIGALSKL